LFGLFVAGELNKSDVHAVDSNNGKNALHALFEHLSTSTDQKVTVNAVKALLENGLDINTKDAHGNTALHCLVFSHCRRDEKLIDMLLAHQQATTISIITTRNNDGYTPLQARVFSE